MLNKYLIGSIIWAILILILTLTPGKSVPDLSIFSYDKLGHGFVFFVLTFLLISGLYENLKGSIRKKRAIYIGITIAASYGFLIEGMQSIIPDRSMETYDAVANVAGCFLGLLLFNIRNKLKA
ncbi:VanZ family protein [Fulvivirga sp. 29W222]|uniref:VanZ family protein n=1 Tax=Fulvivirga marina TaxID=2494733 RepID=A0A937FXN8_9BACT|nr:VanZ family protein [Fulvivirga marina]MBL6446908.1 VanZ family protein [Fulvivirga marina]